MNVLKAEEFKCQIKLLGPDLKNASHVLEYVLAATGGPVQTFEWIIPNASRNQVEQIQITEEGPGVEEKGYPKHDLKPVTLGSGTGEATLLLITYATPLLAGQKKVLTFSYTAPTSALVQRRLTYVRGTYIARFEHRFEIDRFSLKIILPHRMNFIEATPNATHNNSQLDFGTIQLPADHRSVYHVFFGQTPWIPLISATLGCLIAGGLFHAYVVPNIPEHFRKWLFALLATTASAGMLHNVLTPLFSAIFHWLSKGKQR